MSNPTVTVTVRLAETAVNDRLVAPGCGGGCGCNAVETPPTDRVGTAVSSALVPSVNIIETDC